VKQADLIWMNGEFVKWEDAKVHVLTHGLHYGTGVFEGVRCYDTEIGPAVFRHLDHIDRLFKSAELYYMPIPYDRDRLRQSTLELIARNGMRSCYIRPIVFRGYGTMGLFPLDAPVDVTIAVWEWGSYLGEEGKANGIRAKVSSWRRISPDSLIPHAKASGQYLNSILAKIESHKAGYEEAILLDDKGYVCEGSGENIFVVREGKLVTPPQTVWLAPQAAGHTWYPHRFIEPVEVNEPYLGSALSVLGDLLDRVAANGIPTERIALVGFSQGACLALEFVRRRAQRLGAVIGFSGGLIGDTVAPPPPSARPFEGMPVLLGCSERDPHIPIGRVYETDAVMRSPSMVNGTKTTLPASRATPLPPKATSAISSSTVRIAN